MPQITLTQDQTQQFARFLCENNLAQWFVAKDQGAYIGAYSEKTDSNCIFYFRGCDPERNPDWYESTRRFGGDDFGEYFGKDFVLRCALHNRRLRVNVTDTLVKLVGVPA